ncbi:MAG: hypothetical protein U5J83_06870 [Bryobacterales bacterium]|nr:hypothetical protein [Bryobacterales bacterium]
MYDQKHEEYAADFVAIAKRTLDESEYRLFKFHYLLGADWKLCCSRLKIDRGSFFHSVYRVQQKLGRAFRETEPYGIFPVYAYFEDQRREPEAPKAAKPAVGAKESDPRRTASPRLHPVKTEEPYPGERPPVHRRRIA